MAVFDGVFAVNDNKLSSQMYLIIQQTNSTNHEIYSYDLIRKIIVNLGSNKGDKKNHSSPKLTHLHITLFMSIFNKPKKYSSRN